MKILNKLATLSLRSWCVVIVIPSLLVLMAAQAKAADVASSVNEVVIDTEEAAPNVKSIRNAPAPVWQSVGQINHYNTSGGSLVSAPISGTSIDAVDNVVAVPDRAVQSSSQTTVPHGYVEAGGNYHVLTDDMDNWSGAYVKGQVQATPDDSFNALLLNQRQFGSTGNYAAVGNTHQFDENWYSNVSIGGSTNGTFLPRYRVDAFLNRKWLERRQFVTTVGVGYYKSRSIYNDRSLFLGAAYYFEEPWIVQGGIRFNQSRPGSVNSTSQFIAVTQGRAKEYLLTGRYGFGKEAYQIIGPGNILSEFYSHSLSLELRQWLGEDWGINALGESYFSRNYDRNGATLGVFKEF